MSNKVGERFVQEFVIGLGLLGGMGVDPEGMILRALNDSMKSLNPSMDLQLWIIIFSIIATIGAVLGAFAIGGWPGIIAVGLAFIGGIFINTKFGVWMILVAIILGLIAPKIREVL